MDLIKSAVALQTTKITQQAKIAVTKAQHQAEQEIIDMISETIEESKTTKNSSNGQNVDVSI